MTEQIPIRSVIIRVTDKSDDCEAECDLSSKSMITDPIRRHKVLLAINYDPYKFRRKTSENISNQL